MSIKTITNDILSSLGASSGTKPYDTMATVVRVDEEGVCWVHIDGGVDETPTSMAVNAFPGDIVRVRVADGDAWITGNDSKPPTDDAQAFVAKRRAVVAQESAETAQESAEQAQESAIQANESAQQADKNAMSAIALSASNSDVLYGGASISWSAEGSINDGDINVSSIQFANAVGANGTYVIIFDGTDWTLDGNVITLSDYGIEINGSQDNGDQITFFVSDLSLGMIHDVQSAMTTAMTAEEKAGETSNLLEERCEELGLSTENLQELIDDLDEKFFVYSSNMDDFIYCGPDENGDPILILSGGTNSDLETALTNGQLTFYDKGYAVAYINGQKLFISSAHITEELRFGSFAFIPRNNGNLSLKYIGV